MHIQGLNKLRCSAVSALALSTLKLGLRHVNEVFGLSRLRHPGPILGRFPPRFSQVVMRLVADIMLFRIRFLGLTLRGS